MKSGRASTKSKASNLSGKSSKAAKTGTIKTRFEDDDEFRRAQDKYSKHWEKITQFYQEHKGKNGCTVKILIACLRNNGITRDDCLVIAGLLGFSEKTVEVEFKRKLTDLEELRLNADYSKLDALLKKYYVETGLYRGPRRSPSEESWETNDKLAEELKKDKLEADKKLEFNSQASTMNPSAEPKYSKPESLDKMRFSGLSSKGAMQSFPIDLTVSDASMNSASPEKELTHEEWLDLASISRLSSKNPTIENLQSYSFYVQQQAVKYYKQLQALMSLPTSVTTTKRLAAADELQKDHDELLKYVKNIEEDYAKLQQSSKEQATVFEQLKAELIVEVSNLKDLLHEAQQKLENLKVELSDSQNETQRAQEQVRSREEVIERLKTENAELLLAKDAAEKAAAESAAKLPLVDPSASDASKDADASKDDEKMESDEEIDEEDARETMSELKERARRSTLVVCSLQEEKKRHKEQISSLTGQLKVAEEKTAELLGQREEATLLIRALENTNASLKEEARLLSEEVTNQTGTCCKNCVKTWAQLSTACHQLNAKALTFATDPVFNVPLPPISFKRAPTSNLDELFNEFYASAQETSSKKRKLSNAIDFAQQLNMSLTSSSYEIMKFQCFGDVPMDKSGDSAVADENSDPK